ncbi:MAG: hypothetical protein H0X69_15790 [Gemmatimonadales bacterium]|nr:hypothetical protein [Gemmatimonadales bacterium]
MGRYYAEISVTLYADSEDEAISIAGMVADEVSRLPIMAEHGGAEFVDVEGDTANDEG